MISIKLTKEEEQEIKSGKYKNCYLIYNRKSTDEADNQKNSLEYQKSYNLSYLKRKNLDLAPLNIKGFASQGIISEKHSAFKENGQIYFSRNNTIQIKIERPKFYLLSELLSKGYFKGCIFFSYDRASRNRTDTMVIKRIKKFGAEILFSTTEYDKGSSGELHQNVDGIFAMYNSEITREKVLITIRNSRNNGLWTNKAPVGYLNKGNMDYKPIDINRAPIIKEMFKMYATGNYSLSEIARWSIKQGFCMPPVRRRRTIDEVLSDEENLINKIEKISRPPTTNTIHKILNNRFYTGKVITNDGIWIKSKSHKALVGDELFENVQKQLSSKNKSKKYNNVLELTLRNIIRCDVCNRVYTPYKKKGILYYGARCKKDCLNKNNHFNFKYITEKIGALLKNLSFTREELEFLDARTSTEVALLDQKRQSEIEKGERRKKLIREDLSYLASNRLNLLKSGAYTPDSLVQEENRLNSELFSLQKKELISDQAMQNTVRDIVKLSELLKNLYLLYENANPEEKEAIIKEIFSELTINQNELKYQCTMGLKPLENRFVALCDPKTWLSELLEYKPYILSSIQKLEFLTKLTI